MRHRWLLVAAVLLLLLGVAGIALTLGVGNRRGNEADVARRGALDIQRRHLFRPDATPLRGDDASLGASIYLEGRGEDGRTIPRTAIGPGMMGGGCVRCHGIDGRGGFFPMMGGFEAPDITYETLSGEHGHDDEGGWSEAEIIEAITTGVEPDGHELDAFMPRWQLTDTEAEALLDYLKELSQE